MAAMSVKATLLREHGFRYTSVYYDTDEELSRALHSGEIIAAASNRLRETKNESDH